MKTYQYYAGGNWHDPATGQWIDSENPALGEVWARVPDCNADDINRAVQAARGCYDQGPWGRMQPAERGRVITRIGDVITKNAERLGEVETRDNGKLPKNITPSLKSWQTDSFYYYAGMCDKFEGSLLPTEVPDMLNYLRWEPFGVCALITAWNSPLGVLICKLAPALAAGNAVVIKPSEHASVSTLELMSVLQEADLPAGLLNVVTGYGESTGELLVDHPDVRMVSFTGGLSGGRAVAEVAARQVKPVVMELGGKSPQLILKDAEMDLAVNGVVSGIFPATGQSCISGSRILPKGWSDFVSTPGTGWVADGRPIYGGFFWLNSGSPRTHIALPEDAYFMAGAGGQKTIIVPSRDLVIVRIGHYSGALGSEKSLEKMLEVLMQLVPART